MVTKPAHWETAWAVRPPDLRAEEIERLRAENERLRAALEQIADVAHPPDMRAANIAREALGRV